MAIVSRCTAQWYWRGFENCHRRGFVWGWWLCGKYSWLGVLAVSRCCWKLKTAEAFQHQPLISWSGFLPCFLHAALFCSEDISQNAGLPRFTISFGHIYIRLKKITYNIKHALFHNKTKQKNCMKKIMEACFCHWKIV